MVNNDLVVREELALARTRMAQYRTFLAFMRTALYFPVAGISMHQALDISYGLYIQWIGIGIGLLTMVTGIIFYFRATKRVNNLTNHLGNYTQQKVE